MKTGNHPVTGSARFTVAAHGHRVGYGLSRIDELEIAPRGHDGHAVGCEHAEKRLIRLAAGDRIGRVERRLQRTNLAGEDEPPARGHRDGAHELGELGIGEVEVDLLTAADRHMPCAEPLFDGFAGERPELTSPIFGHRCSGRDLVRARLTAARIGTLLGAFSSAFTDLLEFRGDPSLGVDTAGRWGRRIPLLAEGRKGREQDGSSQTSGDPGTRKAAREQVVAESKSSVHRVHLNECCSPWSGAGRAW